jgi:hypothetical protein
MVEPLFIRIVLEKCRQRLASMLEQPESISIKDLEDKYNKYSSSLHLNMQATAALGNPEVIKMLFEHGEFWQLRMNGNAAAHQLELEDAKILLKDVDIRYRRELTLMVNWFFEVSEPVPA